MKESIKLNNEIAILKSIVKDQDKEIKILRKALELACEQIWAMHIWENPKEEVIQDNIEYFKTKAKEMMKSE
jgi:hypothetical protein